MIHPSFDEFKRLAKKHDGVPVFLECLADELTPMALFHSLYEKSPRCFLLESVEGGEHLGRYSFAAFEPFQVFKSRARECELETGGRSRKWESENPFNELRGLLRSRRAAEVKGLPRFFGGAVGYASYDVVRHFERLPDNHPDDLRTPDMFFFFTRDMFVFDHLAHSVKIVRCLFPKKGDDLRALYRRAERALAKTARDIRLAPFRAKPVSPPPPAAAKEDPRERAAFLAAVRKAKDYIAAGDIIQTVLSRRVSFPTKAHPVEIYRALRCVNPSPYMYFLRDKDTHLIGTSPEMLVRLEDRTAETRPIAGTRPRGKNAPDDDRLAAELVRDEKERAEHLMLVDLGRNDLGRVCRPGTVRVPDFMTVERYSHVMHLVSSVVGQLDPRRDAFDLFRACFPAGTLSGAPKIRAMEIIDELESARRGPYGGAVGYFSYSGNMDVAITIRTILLARKAAHVQAGAGIVADSVPEKEYRETQNKAAAMLAAIRLAETRRT
ncbi:MAG TPA: anthranilate synthase component I [Elusimicrobiota bacterium]|nr:anthranilate synthase component I [Elusimicrobiota bacterium]